jgi:signal transduction histidine kinase
MHIRTEVGLPDLAAVPDAIGRHALRIVQEALTNARKHATAAPVELRLDGAPRARSHHRRNDRADPGADRR